METICSPTMPTPTTVTFSAMLTSLNRHKESHCW
jgi:hypothetical protein